MTTEGTRATVRSSGSRDERGRVLLLAGLIVIGVAAWLMLDAMGGERGAARGLLPHQALVQALSESEQSMYRAIRLGLPAAAADRARDARWPDAAALADQGVAPFSASSGGAAMAVRWERFQQGVTVNYFGRPADPSAPAWLLDIREPEAGAPPDPAPEDEEHHRLPDGTMLHVFVWMHRYGGRVAPRLVPQPEAEGWIQVFTAPPNPIAPVRR